MSAVLEAEASVTERYQNTIPAPIRKALGLQKNDKVVYAVESDGRITVRRKSSDTDQGDPVLARFLGFLERDIDEHPARIEALPASLRDRIEGLVGDIEVDLEQPLTDDED